MSEARIVRDEFRGTRFVSKALIALGLFGLVLCVSATALATPASSKLAGCTGRPLSHVYWETATKTGFVVRKVSVGGGAVTTLVTDNVSGQWPRTGPSLAVNCARVFWPDPSHGTLQSVPVGGGKRAGVNRQVLGYRNLAVDGNNVYFGTSRGEVDKVPVGGGTATTLVSGAPRYVSVLALAIDSTHVYWLTYNSSSCIGQVNEIPLGGGTATTLATTPNCKIKPGLAVNSTHVYWSTGSTVQEVPLGGGTVTTLVSGEKSPHPIAVDGKHLYWVTGTSVKEVPLGGGKVMTLASGQSWPTSLAAYGGYLYWAAGTGQVRKVSTGGGMVTALATGQSVVNGPPTGGPVPPWSVTIGP